MTSTKEEKLPDQQIDQNAHRVRILLSAQQALIGHITPSIREIALRWNASEITLEVSYDEKIFENDHKHLTEIISSIIKDFPAKKIRKTISFVVPRSRIDRSELKPNEERRLVYEKAWYET